jgi:hypothetical protein
MLLERIKEVKEKVDLLEQEARNPEHSGKYSWAAIKTIFEQELPILSADAIEKFRLRLEDCTDTVDTATAAKRKKYGQRRRIPDVPSALDMTVHMIDYLKTCKNMMASKEDIFNGIKDKYSPEVQAIPHRSRGEDRSGISALQYRLEWACTILALNGKAIGRNQDPAIPKRHLKLISTTKFTEAEIAHLKKNRNSLVGFKNKKR